MTPARTKKPELLCPAGTPSALRTAVEAGADAVYCGFQNATNARNFAGLNFTEAELRQAVAFAHARGAKVLLTLNTFPPAGAMDLWKRAADAAADIGVDAVILADPGVAAYCAERHPGLRRHLSVQAAASTPEAIAWWHREFGIARAVLPRILAAGEIRDLVRAIPCEVEAFLFGNHGLMVEGRCAMSSYLTGRSTNMDGSCSPASHISYEHNLAGDMTMRLGSFAVDCFACGQSAGYPTPCKGRYVSTEQPGGYHAFEEPVTLNLAPILPEMMAAGVAALKIEGRQRSKAYVRMVVGAFRAAIDDIAEGRAPAMASLLSLTEGGAETTGAAGGGGRWR
ncbi:MAG TPA: protease [Rhodospirillaceae bacterium]|jgi:collagenase-like PrtC family protease|nr:U32 family peptidase [Alphaproteobacteria bacterium]HBH25897.1 protease [Rhodospirillaceae bacterium]